MAFGCLCLQRSSEGWTLVASNRGLAAFVVLRSDFDQLASGRAKRRISQRGQRRAIRQGQRIGL